MAVWMLPRSPWHQGAAVPVLRMAALEAEQCPEGSMAGTGSMWSRFPAVRDLRGGFAGCPGCAGIVAAGGDTLRGLGSARPQPRAVEFAG